MALEVPGAQALHHVVVDVVRQRVGQRGDSPFFRGGKSDGPLEAHEIRAHGIERDADQFAQVERDAGLDQDPEHAERGAAKAIGVLGAGRFLADREDADQRVQLVGDGEREPGARRREQVTRETRQVLLGQGGRHLVGFAVVQGVVAPHDALQLRELADHRGQQVALGQLRRPLRVGGISAGRAGNLHGERRDPRGLVGERAELRLEGDGGQRPPARFERRLAICRVEKGRIGQPRPHDPLVAGAHLRRIPAFDIGHGDKEGQERPVRRTDREVPLVVLQGRHQHLRRQLEEARFEPARDRDRPFGQGRDLVQYGGIDRARRRPPASAAAVTPFRMRSRRASKSASTWPRRSSEAR